MSTHLSTPHSSSFSSYASPYHPIPALSVPQPATSPPPSRCFHLSLLKKLLFSRWSFARISCVLEKPKWPCLWELFSSLFKVNPHHRGLAPPSASLQVVSYPQRVLYQNQRSYFSPHHEQFLKLAEGPS